MDKVSIIILNWNRYEDAVKAIDSVLAQTYDDYEIILWDNGSSDDSRIVLTERYRTCERVRLIFADKNYGPAIGRNRACEMAEGDIFIFLDSDSILLTPDALAIITEGFSRLDHAAALNFEIRTPTGEILWPFARPLSAWREKEFDITRVDGCGVAFRRDAFDAAHGFPAHFGYGAEEAYLARRCISLGYSIIYFPHVAVEHAAVVPGRTNDQFMTMMRNHIWMPLELFRMPWALVSALNMTTQYLRDAIRENRLGDFAGGLKMTIADFRLSRREPMTPEAWRRFRAIIKEDRGLATWTTQTSSFPTAKPQ